MQSPRRSALHVLFAGLAAGACTEQTPPTGIPVGPNAALAAAGANNQKVKVKQMQLSSNTLRINGAAVSGQVTIGNSGVVIQDVVVRAEITQGSASKQAVASTPTQCSANPDDAGKLPNGTCEMTFSASASNAGAGPDLVPGSATFTLHVAQTSGTGETELASKSLIVNLVGVATMTVTVDPTVYIDGPAPATATAIIQNPGGPIAGMSLEGWIVQASGATRREAGETQVTCGSSAGILPPGTCTMTVPVTASTVSGGIGLLASGAATFELDLVQSSNGAATTIDVKTAPTTLVWYSPHFTSVEVQSTTLEIGGPSVGFTVDIQNGGPPRSDIILGVEIKQFINGSLDFINHDAGSLAVTCGGPAGTLPTTGTGVCTVQSNLFAAGDANGGAFTPGPAVLYFDILNSTGTLDRRTVNVTLVDKPVRITGVTLPQSITLGGGAAYTVFIQNDGASLSTVVLQAYLSQGTTQRAAGGRTIQCGSGTIGVLPTGSCSAAASMSAFNAPNGGTGTLVPGPAVLEIDLVQSNGGVSTELDKTFANVTLVMTEPGIIGIELAATDILIGEGTTYTATLYNPTSTTVTGVGIDGFLTQGSIVDFGAGGTILTCAGAAQATLPPGSCQVSFTLNTRNIDGTPNWQPGPATFRLELNSTTLLDSQEITVYLYRLF